MSFEKSAFGFSSASIFDHFLPNFRGVRGTQAHLS
jgi:hypothetical protein